MDLKISRPAGYRAALYIRLSKEDENEGPSESVNNQKSLLEEFVRKQGLQVFDTYVDDGWSGTDFDRPAFRRMIADIEAGRVNLVLTKDLSRLGRDYILTGHYMERYFPEHRVRYISLLDGIDTGVDSTANDITPFRAIMNDMYAKDISKKIKSVKRDKQRKGLFIGGKPVYGYKMHPTEKNRIIVDEKAAPTVRRIFGMALSGMSCRQIAARLNAEQIPPPAVYAGLPAGPGHRTGRWSSERISDMLQNETYIGSMVQGRRIKISYKSKKCLRQSRSDWVVVQNTHAPLVDRQDFQMVQRLIGSRRHTRSRSYDFLLKGLIFCRECGHPLGVINRRNAKGEDVLYFVCRTYQRDTHAGACTSHSVQEMAVNQAVSAKLREICRTCLDAGRLRGIAEEAVEQAGRAGDREAETRTVQDGITALTAHLDRIYMDRLHGLLSEADFQRIYCKVKADRAALEARLQALNEREKQPPDAGEAAGLLTERFLDAVPENRALLVSLVERVELTAEKELVLRFRFRKPAGMP